ncbi:hypothetical protein DD595_26245, partial [Enterobacter cloacae complex sp. 4DZ3-17B2]|uniref:hypothetical protein n=1 Tax=Enterobacter cloacae complex sp. 4DZ3-17B2 TaxID=2511990 RepID=UPI0010266C06
ESKYAKISRDKKRLSRRDLHKYPKKFAKIFTFVNFATISANIAISTMKIYAFFLEIKTKMFLYPLQFLDISNRFPVIRVCL